MYALDNNWQARDPMAEPTRVPLTADEYQATVRLYTLPTELGMVMDFKFRLTLKPEISIYMISATSPDEKQLCPNQSLHDLEVSDRQNISNTFRIIGVLCKTHLGEVPFIEFTFGLYNMGLASVSIDDSISGRIGFFKNRKSEQQVLNRAPVMAENLARNCQFRRDCRFSIRQEISREEADMIQRNIKHSSFFLGGLRITMHGEEVSGVRLETPFSVETNGYELRGHGEVFFGGEQSQIALYETRLSQLEGRHQAEMRRVKNRLPAIQTLSAVHGAGLHFIEELKNSRLTNPKQSVESWWSGLIASIEIQVSHDAMDEFCKESPPIPDSPEELRNWVKGRLDKLATLMNGLWEDDQDYAIN